MDGDPFKRLGWWWNKSWGTLTRRDVWLEHSQATGVFKLRWRVGSYPETEELFLTADRVVAMLRRLLGEDRSVWQENMYLDKHGTLWDYQRPTDAERAIENYIEQAEADQP